MTDKIVNYPHSIEAEQALLGGLIANNQKIPDVIDNVTVEHFFIKDHQLIYASIKKIFEQQDYVSWVDISNDLCIQTGMQGSDYLKELEKSVYPKSNLSNYCIVIKENYLLRELYNLGEFCQQSTICTEGKTPNEILQSIEEKLYPLSLLTQNAKEYISLQEILLDNIDEFSSKEYRYQPIETQFKRLNQYECFHKSALTLVAARPSIGKTSFMLNLLTKVSEKESVLFISLENEASKIGKDLFSINSGISGDVLKNKGHLTPVEWDRLMDYAADMKDVNVFIRDIPTCTINTLTTLYRSLNSKLLRDGKPPIGMVIIDYLGLIRPANPKKQANLYQHMTELSRDLKMFAMKYQVSLVGICQLNREVDKRADKIPQLSDLRDSGSLEQDADSVLMLYKPPETVDRLNVFIAKNRHGKAHDILEFGWYGACKQVYELSNTVHIDTHTDYKLLKTGEK